MRLIIEERRFTELDGGFCVDARLALLHPRRWQLCLCRVCTGRIVVKALVQAILGDTMKLIKRLLTVLLLLALVACTMLWFR